MIIPINTLCKDIWQHCKHCYWHAILKQSRIKQCHICNGFSSYWKINVKTKQRSDNRQKEIVWSANEIEEINCELSILEVISRISNGLTLKSRKLNGKYAIKVVNKIPLNNWILKEKLKFSAQRPIRYRTFL